MLLVRSIISSNRLTDISVKFRNLGYLLLGYLKYKNNSDFHHDTTQRKELAKFYN